VRSAASACLAVTLALAFGCGGEGEAERSASSLARSVSDDLGGVLMATRERLVRLARLPEVREGRRRECRRAMAARLSPPYTALGAITRNGDLYCLSEPTPEPINVSDRVYFLRAVGGRDLGVGDFQVGRATGESSLGLGYPVLGARDEVSGVVLAPLSLRWLQERLEQRRDPAAQDVLVTDDHGTVLARVGERTASGENLGRERLVQAMLERGEGSGEFALAGDRRHYVFSAVPHSDGQLHVAVGARP